MVIAFMNNNKEDAIYDCKGIVECSKTALDNHLNLWLNTTDELGGNDALYLLTLKEIQAKCGTQNCLLKEI